MYLLRGAVRSKTNVCMVDLVNCAMVEMQLKKEVRHDNKWPTCRASR